MRDIVPLFVVMAIGIRTNSLDAASISNRHRASLAREMRKFSSARRGEEVEPSKFEKAQNLYSEIDLENQVLNDDALIDMLVRGRYNKKAICASLDNSTYFAKADELPPWRRVMEFDKLPDKVVEEAVSAMEQQFTTRAVSEVGEMLHIFALRMMMAKHGMLAHTVEYIAEEDKAYIDNLLDVGRLPSSYKEDFEDDILGMASYGYTFWIEDSYRELFANVVEHLRAQWKVALERKYPAIGDQLLVMLRTKPEEFAGAISYLAGGTHNFALLPVMKAIPVKEFVEAWLNAPNWSDVWRWTRAGFEQRYKGIALSPDNGWLASEAEWVREVLVEMRNRAEAETGFRRFRIERAIPRDPLPDTTS